MRAMPDAGPARIAYRIVVSFILIFTAACAAPMQRAAPRTAPATARAPMPTPVGRPTVGVAFGGGSARGIAHAGVIRWLEEHRVPIDVAAGTSMGGLVGGAYATGMDADELRAFITSLDWDHLFGASSFQFKNIRRKADARAYPSRLEFGLRGGIVPPTALNSGEYVELLLARMTAPYFNIASFDELPTPFRSVAVDLLSARPVVMDSGSLADALRATMSLPLIFPPMHVNGSVLVDGGTMNNIPADVVRAMGADRVIAINVGDLSDREGVSATLLGVAGDTIDAMMRASTRRVIADADVLINVPLRQYHSLDWRRAADLIDEGYRAAEAVRDRLLPLALSQADFDAWRRERHRRRRSDLPTPAFVELDGFARDDATRLSAVLARHVAVPINPAEIERDIALITGLDRYQAVTWSLMQDETRGSGLRVRARVKSYAPPFMMIGLNLENTTSSDFRISATARYLAFDTVGSGSELRIDGTLGSDPSIGVELYRPIGPTPLFVAPYAGVAKARLNFIDEDAVVARYSLNTSRIGLNVGVNLGARSDVRIGAYLGRTVASIDVGDPGFPELRGKETGAELRWRVDTQDSPVVASSGLLAEVHLLRKFDSPDIVVSDRSFDYDATRTQLSAAASRFWSVGPANRVFAYGAAGSSFDAVPLPTDQFTLGTPFRLGAYDAGELRGPNYYVATGGYLRRVGRLPDFMGGPVFAGGWLENGDVFDDWNDAGWRTNAGVGLVLDTLVGPFVLAGTWSFDGRWRTYFGVGRIFR